MSWIPSILRPRVRHDAQIADYHTAPFYPVGAGDVVYEPPYPIVPAMLPPVGLLGSAVYAGWGGFGALNGPPMWVNQTAFVAGIGGPVSGQFIGQPLNIPDTSAGHQ
jgi:hypothetical protein